MEPQPGRTRACGRPARSGRSRRCARPPIPACFRRRDRLRREPEGREPRWRSSFEPGRTPSSRSSGTRSSHLPTSARSSGGAGIGAVSSMRNTPGAACRTGRPIGRGRRRSGRRRGGARGRCEGRACGVPVRIRGGGDTRSGRPAPSPSAPSSYRLTIMPPEPIRRPPAARRRPSARRGGRRWPPCVARDPGPARRRRPRRARHARDRLGPPRWRGPRPGRRGRRREPARPVQRRAGGTRRGHADTRDAVTADAVARGHPAAPLAGRHGPGHAPRPVRPRRPAPTPTPGPAGGSVDRATSAALQRRLDAVRARLTIPGVSVAILWDDGRCGSAPPGGPTPPGASR